MAKEKRFIVTYDEGAFGLNKILVDVKTGVNYLFHAEGYAGSITVLLNRDGTPVVTPIPRDEE